MENINTGVVINGVYYSIDSVNTIHGIAYYVNEGTHTIKSVDNSIGFKKLEDCKKYIRKLIYDNCVITVNKIKRKKRIITIEGEISEIESEE
jgi:hypothetical protein